MSVGTEQSLISGRDDAGLLRSLTPAVSYLRRMHETVHVWASPAIDEKEEQTTVLIDCSAAARPNVRELQLADRKSRRASLNARSGLSISEADPRRLKERLHLELRTAARVPQVYPRKKKRR